MDQIKNILIKRVLAKLPILEEYFDSNAEIQFSGDLFHVIIDNTIIGCREDVLNYKWLQELRENWINENSY